MDQEYEKSGNYFNTLSLLCYTFINKRVRRLKRLLFGPKRPSIHQREPDSYFKSIHLSRITYERIKLIVECNGGTLKDTVDKLISIGMYSYLFRLFSDQSIQFQYLTDEQQRTLGKLILELKKCVEEINKSDFMF